jgi:hypothetical protein
MCTLRTCCFGAISADVVFAAYWAKMASFGTLGSAYWAKGDLC